VEAVPTGAGGFPEDAASGSTAAGDQGLAWSPVSMAGDCPDLRCREDDSQALNFQADDSLRSAVFPAARLAPVVRQALVAYWAAEEDPARTPAAFPW